MLPDGEQADRDEHGADDQGVKQDAERDGGSDLGDIHLRDLRGRRGTSAGNCPAASP